LQRQSTRTIRADGSMATRAFCPAAIPTLFFQQARFASASRAGALPLCRTRGSGVQHTKL
jgi:hypothetical protein